ncbi:hypothetical protein [Telmatospirillum sp.]|uniref:hypothetical protein n=1 Tax=Telmatospirillum sp. TaxID=2079197 RepID=UPI00284FAABF|nr:hypothetical protein [Telmatospirillum sp.]MDR3437464.1 hypothetical protein [Telmatospirillum sp.]
MRTAVFLAMLVCGTVLSGCSMVEGLLDSDDTTASQNQMNQQRLDRMTQDINACSAARKAGQTTTRVDYARCVNAAFQSAMFDVNYSYPDIVATLSAERLRVAELADKGTISDAEGQARLSDKIAETVRLDRARSNSVGKSAKRTPPTFFLQIMQVGL